MDDVVQRVDLLQLEASRGLRQHVDDDLPDREVVKVRRNLGVGGEEPREEVAGVDPVLHLFLHPRDRTCDNIIIIFIYIVPSNPINAIVQLRFTMNEIKMNVPVRSCKIKKYNLDKNNRQELLWKHGLT